MREMRTVCIGHAHPCHRIRARIQVAGATKIRRRGGVGRRRCCTALTKVSLIVGTKSIVVGCVLLVGTCTAAAQCAVARGSAKVIQRSIRRRSGCRQSATTTHAGAIGCRRVHPRTLHDVCAAAIHGIVVTGAAFKCGRSGRRVVV